MIFCTVTTLNRIHMAMVMAKSVKEHHPNAGMAVCVVEEEIPEQARSFKYFDHIVLAKNLGHPDFYRHMFKYKLDEGCWSLKPRLLLYLMRTFQAEDRLVYLDTDTKMFGPFHEVNQVLDQSPIVLTPHITHPSMQDELEISKHGLYNSGFIALKRTKESLRFLDWWTERLDRMCYRDLSRGIFGDQRWLDHAPVFFDVHILQHPGYNVAKWNIYYRNITLTNGQFLVNGLPLRFYHFAEFSRIRYLEIIKGMLPDQRHPIHLLVDQYSRELSEMGYHPSRTFPCSYNFYRSGEPIDMRARLIYRNKPKRFARIQNPFAMSNRTFLGRGKPSPKRKGILAGKIRLGNPKRKLNQNRRLSNRNRRKRNVMGLR
jgi:hypothetical protein